MGTTEPKTLLLQRTAGYFQAPATGLSSNYHGGAGKQGLRTAAAALPCLGHRRPGRTVLPLSLSLSLALSPGHGKPQISPPLSLHVRFRSLEVNTRHDPRACRV